jgi:hypothetical protein
VGARCPRCLELEDEINELRQRLAAVGQFVVASPGTNLGLNVERELARWLAVNPHADAASGFRAGWARLARLVSARLRDWEGRWFRSMRENDRLRSRIGVLVSELSRLRDRA